MKIGMLAMVLFAAALHAQEETTSVVAETQVSALAVDTAKVARDGEAVALAESQPRYRNREPMRAAGTPKEQVTGNSTEVGPDKTSRLGGDW